MIRILLLIVSISCLLGGCKSKDAVPSNVLPQKKMQAVLWDMMRADQFLGDYVLNKDTSLKLDKESSKLYQQIFAINNISKEQFQKSFSFYKSHPLLLKAIMDSIANAPAEIIAADTAKPVIIKDSLNGVSKDSLKLKADSSNNVKKADSIRMKKKNSTIKKRKMTKTVL